MMCGSELFGVGTGSGATLTGVVAGGSGAPVVIRPILLPALSVNHRLPSGPDVMSKGADAAVGTRNSVMTPPVVMRPILLPDSSVNQRFPSVAAAMPSGSLPAVGTGNSTIAPSAGIRPILLPDS